MPSISRSGPAITIALSEGAEPQALNAHGAVVPAAQSQFVVNVLSMRLLYRRTDEMTLLCFWEWLGL
jgi:hypothetical protein